MPGPDVAAGRTEWARAAAAAAAALLCLAATGAGAEPISVHLLTHIYGIAPDPDDPGRLYAASERGMFALTPDGLADRISGGETAVTAFAASQQWPGLCLSAAESAGVLASLDFGRSWSPVPGRGGTPGPFLALHASPVDAALVYGAAKGNLYQSSDGGVTWTDLGAAPAAPIDLATSPRDRDAVYLGTAAGLFRSLDAGLSWQEVALEGITGAVTLVEVTPDGLLYAFGAGAGLFTSANSRAWELSAAAGFDGVLIHLAGRDGGGPVFAVTQFMKILMSADQGRGPGPRLPPRRQVPTAAHRSLDRPRRLLICHPNTPAPPRGRQPGVPP